jgi:hypothetical protein
MWIYLTLGTGSFFFGVFASKVLKYIKFPGKPIIQQDSTIINRVNNDKELKIESNIIDDSEVFNIDIIKARQKLEYIIDEERLLKQDINARITSLRIIRLYKAVSKLEKNIFDLHQEIQKQEKLGIENEQLQFLQVKKNDIKKLEDFKNKLNLALEKLISLNLPTKKGNPEAADIVIRRLEERKKPK